LENSEFGTGEIRRSEKPLPVKSRRKSLRQSMATHAACFLAPLVFSAGLTAFASQAKTDTGITKQTPKSAAHASPSKSSSKAAAPKSIAAKPIAAKPTASKFKVTATAKPAAKAAPAKWTVAPGQKSGEKPPVFTAKSTVGSSAKTRAKTMYARTWVNPPARRPVATWRTAQMVPAPDRYKEIQEALAAKGYFQNTPDGTWGPDSVEALKRFQTDQKLENDGKLGSLSLLALGLGPKRGSTEASAKPDPQAQPGVPFGVDPVVGAAAGQVGEPAAQPTPPPVP